jgi:uncharacterized repeat protein (TIGR02543 family)
MKMKKLLATLTIVAVVLMFGCKKDEYQAKVGLCPLVVSTIPADNAVGIPLNQVVSATFNEKMDPAMFMQQTFTLSATTAIAGTKAATTVSGTVVFSGMTAFFTPTSPLTPNTTYTGMIKAGVKDLLGNALQADHVWSFSTDVSPTVSADPINNSVDVLLSKVIIATFSVPMDTLTLKTPATTITVKQGATVVPGKYSFTTTTASFKPDVALTPFTVYTTNITTAAKNSLGTPLSAEFVSTFTTIPQVIVSSLPVLGGTTTGGGTYVQGSAVALTAVPSDGYTFTNWTEGTTIVSPNASFELNMAGNKTLVANFAISTYTLGVTSVNGSVAKLPNSLTYNVGTPVVLTPSPATGFVFSSWSGDATGNANPLTVTMNSNKNITANFTAIVAGTFTLNVNAVNGTVVKNPNQLSYLNGTNVALTATPNSGYVFSSWSGDATGSVSPVTVNMNSIKNVTANFTLMPVANCPVVVDLGLAGDYVILSKAGISTTGITSVTGDMGISPAAATSITGFNLILTAASPFSTSAMVTGQVFAPDYNTPTPTLLTTAINNMQTAFTAANGLLIPAPTNEYLAGNLNGQTLSKGIFKWSSNVLVTSGIVLDGGGDPCATFIFQIAGDLTVANNTIITLQNGAKAKNVFWVVAGSKAALGTGVDFSGNILCKELISLNTGAKVNGKLLAQTSVTLNASTVTDPQ